MAAYRSRTTDPTSIEFCEPMGRGGQRILRGSDGLAFGVDEEIITGLI